MTDASIPAAYRCLPHSTFEIGEFALRSVQPQDIEAIRRWRNEQMDVLRQSEPIGADAQTAYFETTVWPEFASERPTKILLAFSEGGRLIGYGGLVHIAWEHRRAEVSFLLQSELIRDARGYCARFSAYLGLIRELAFRSLGFHRLFTETYAFRNVHIETLEQAGFRLEGRMRDHVIIEGKRTDSLIHGCLADD
jgi:RimJ/RimL family protein N-acetyltransferase